MVVKNYYIQSTFSKYLKTVQATLSLFLSFTVVFFFVIQRILRGREKYLESNNHRIERNLKTWPIAQTMSKFLCSMQSLPEHSQKETGKWVLHKRDRSIFWCFSLKETSSLVSCNIHQLFLPTDSVSAQNKLFTTVSFHLHPWKRLFQSFEVPQWFATLKCPS